MNQRAQRFTEAGAVVLVSFVMVGLVVWAVDRVPFVEAIAAFYAPVWLVVVAVFGGIHGAPAWAGYPSLLIAYSIQNLVLWFGGKWLIRHVAKRVGET